MARRSLLVGLCLLKWSSGCSIAPDHARSDLERATALAPKQWSDEWSDADWIERINGLGSVEAAERGAAARVADDIRARHASPAVRIAAIDVLVRIGSEELRAEALRAALTDRSDLVRAHAASMALTIVGPSVRPEYSRLLGPAQPAAVRRAALIELTSAPPDAQDEPELTARVVACTADIDPGVRYHACALLAKAAPDGPIGADARSAPEAWLTWWRSRAVQAKNAPANADEGTP